MAGNPIQDILQMLMSQGGAMPPGGGNIPMMPQQGPQEAAIAAVSPQSQNSGMMGIGLPPQMASLMPPSGMPPGMASPAEVSESENMESFRDPQGERSEYDPNFPEDYEEEDMESREVDPEEDDTGDPVRAQTESELDDVRNQMSTEDEDFESGGETPTQKDLDMLREHPTDGMIRDFAERFPKYIAELILMEGGDPSRSPDQYAMSDEEYAETQKDRSTRIDER